jgi:hypothetical protein
MCANNRRTSVIWGIDPETFQEVCLSKDSLAEILRHFGLHAGAGNYRTIRRRISLESVDISHLSHSLKGRGNPLAQKPLEHYLIYGEVSRSTLKRKLLQAGFLKNECSVCGLGGEWQGGPITHRLDHIDGDSKNNVLANLRMVCPNCDSQSSTYCSRNIQRERHNCVDCGKAITAVSTRCILCAVKARPQLTKIDWPPTEELLIMVAERPFTTVAKELGVSDNAIRNRLKRH